MTAWTFMARRDLQREPVHTDKVCTIRTGEAAERQGGDPREGKVSSTHRHAAAGPKAVERLEPAAAILMPLNWIGVWVSVFAPAKPVR